MAKDWSGDANSIFKQLGATSHSEREREREREPGLLRHGSKSYERLARA